MTDFRKKISNPSTMLSFCRLVQFLNMLGTTEWYPDVTVSNNGYSIKLVKLKPKKRYYVR